MGQPAAGIDTASPASHPPLPAGTLQGTDLAASPPRRPLDPASTSEGAKPANDDELDRSSLPTLPTLTIQAEDDASQSPTFVIAAEDALSTEKAAVNGLGYGDYGGHHDSSQAPQLHPSSTRPTSSANMSSSLSALAPPFRPQSDIDRWQFKPEYMAMGSLTGRELIPVGS